MSSITMSWVRHNLGTFSPLLVHPGLNGCWGFLLDRVFAGFERTEEAGSLIMF